MKILVALACAVIGQAVAAASCDVVLRTYLKRQLSPARMDELPGQVVTLVTHAGTRRGVVTASHRSRSNALAIRFLDQDTNRVDDLVYSSHATNLKRVLIHGPAPEIKEARRRAGPDAESAFFEPFESTPSALQGWLDLGSPVVLVVAREGDFGLEILEGRLAPWTERPTILSIDTADGPRQFHQLRLVAAFGRWAGF